MKTYSESILPELKGWEERMALLFQGIEANRTIGRNRARGGGITMCVKAQRTPEQFIADCLHLIQAADKEQCWEWKGATYKYGYGRIARFFWLGEFYNKSHRVMAALRYGRLSPNQFACHHCDNPRCCNPYHLFIGTNKENLSEMHLKGRHPQPIGSNHCNSKLTEEQVIEIKGHLPNPRYGWLSALSRKFQVCPEAIRVVALGKAWAHIPGPVWKSSRPYNHKKKITK